MSPEQTLAQIRGTAAEAPLGEPTVAERRDPARMAMRQERSMFGRQAGELAKLVGAHPSPLVMKSLEAVASDLSAHGSVSPAAMARVKIAAGVSSGALSPDQGKALGRSVDLLRRGWAQMDQKGRDPNVITSPEQWASLQRNMKVMSELTQRVESLIANPKSLNMTAVAHIQRVMADPNPGMAINGLNNALRDAGLGEVARPYAFRPQPVMAIAEPAAPAAGGQTRPAHDKPPRAHAPVAPTGTTVNRPWPMGNNA